MKILLLTEFYPPLRNPDAYCMAKLAQSLSNGGHSVTVITQDHTIRSKLPPDRSPMFYGSPVIVHALSAPEGRGFRLGAGIVRPFFKSVDWAWWTRAAIKLARKTCDGSPPDLLLTGAEVYRTAIAGEALARAWGIPWQAIFNDPSPVSLYPPPYKTPIRVAFRDRFHFFRAREALRHADALLFPSRRLECYVMKKYGFSREKKTGIVRHIGSLLPDDAPSSPPLRVLHCGRILGPRASQVLVSTLEETLKACREEKLPVKFIFFGAADSSALARLARNWSEYLELLPGGTYEESLKQIAAAHVLLLIEAPMNEGIFLPSKLADYALSGKPMLFFSPENGEVADLAGGTTFPGLLGQDPGKAATRILRMVRQQLAGKSAVEYRFPDVEIFRAQTVVRDIF